MSAELPSGLLDEVVSGDAAATEHLEKRVAQSGLLGARYMSGDTVGAWRALVAAGPAALTLEGRLIAYETMRRVRRNLERIVPRLEQVGYRRAQPGGLGPTIADATLDEYEEQLGGPLPLSLRAFWRMVGSIDLRQSARQMVHDWLEVPPSELHCLGDDDPLVVPDPESFDFEGAAEYDDSQEEYPDVEDARLGRFLFPLSSDRFHKAEVSGGPGYGVWLPQPAADFRIFLDVFHGADGGHGQWFVEMLRDTQLGGGFRGPIDRTDDDWRRLPLRKLERELGDGLLAI